MPASCHSTAPTTSCCRRNPPGMCCTERGVHAFSAITGREARRGLEAGLNRSEAEVFRLPRRGARQPVDPPTRLGKSEKTVRNQLSVVFSKTRVNEPGTGDRLATRAADFHGTFALSLCGPCGKEASCAGQLQPGPVLPDRGIGPRQGGQSHATRRNDAEHLHRKSAGAISAVRSSIPLVRTGDALGLYTALDPPWAGRRPRNWRPQPSAIPATSASGCRRQVASGLTSHMRAVTFADARTGLRLRPAP